MADVGGGLTGDVIGPGGAAPRSWAGSISPQSGQKTTPCALSAPHSGHVRLKSQPLTSRFTGGRARWLARPTLSERGHPRALAAFQPDGKPVHMDQK